MEVFKRESDVNTSSAERHTLNAGSLIETDAEIFNMKWWFRVLQMHPVAMQAAICLHRFSSQAAFR